MAQIQWLSKLVNHAKLVKYGEHVCVCGGGRGGGVGGCGWEGGRRGRRGVGDTYSPSSNLIFRRSANFVNSSLLLRQSKNF